MTTPTRLEARVPARRLPVPARLRPGDTAAGYIARLAAANHLPLAHLRSYLRPPGRFSTIVDLDRLAAISGHEPQALLRAFAAPRCLHCGSVLPRRGRKQSAPWCSSDCRQAAATARRAKPWTATWSLGRCTTCSAQMTRPYWESFCCWECRMADPTGPERCRRCGTQIERPAVGRPPLWCSARCRRAGYDARRRKASANRHRDWHLVTTHPAPTP